MVSAQCEWRLWAIGFSEHCSIIPIPQLLHYIFGNRIFIRTSILESENIPWNAIGGMEPNVDNSESEGLSVIMQASTNQNSRGSRECL